MKTILIATDFSNASRNATCYGIQFAKAINAKAILFNAYKVLPSVAAFHVGKSRFAIKVQTAKRLLKEAEIFDPSGEIIEILCDEGAPEQAILNIANQKKID